MRNSAAFRLVSIILYILHHGSAMVWAQALLVVAFIAASTVVSESWSVDEWMTLALWHSIIRKVNLAALGLRVR